MLHAFSGNKSRAYRYYVGHREGLGHRVSSEDEITSIIFGPLDFLPASNNWFFWRTALTSHETVAASGPLPGDFFDPSFTPISCEMKFWMRRDNVEPDLVVDFLDAGGAARSILLEVKWDAGLSGDDQLLNQWTVFQAGRHATSLHVLLAKQTDNLELRAAPWSVDETDGRKSNRLRLLRWHGLHRDLHHVWSDALAPDPIRRWAALAAEFLSRVGIRPFVGFHQTVQLAASIEIATDEDVAFWRNDNRF